MLICWLDVAPKLRRNFIFVFVHQRAMAILKWNKVHCSLLFVYCQDGPLSNLVGMTKRHRIQKFYPELHSGALRNKTVCLKSKFYSFLFNFITCNDFQLHKHFHHLHIQNTSYCKMINFG